MQSRIVLVFAVALGIAIGFVLAYATTTFAGGVGEADLGQDANLFEQPTERRKTEVSSPSGENTPENFQKEPLTNDPLRSDSKSNVEVEASSSSVHVDIPDTVESAASSADIGYSGEGVIRGIVRGPNGKGLPGVAVSAEFSLASQLSYEERSPIDLDARPDWVDGSSSLQEKINALIRAYRKQGLRRKQTTTDEDGEFRFENLGDVSASIRAYKSGYNFRSIDSARGVKPGENVAFLASKLAELEINVLTPDGEPAPFAQLDLKNLTFTRNGTIRQYWNANERIVELPEGRYTLTASYVDEEAEMQSEEISVSVTSDERAKIDVPLSGEPTIRVKLLPSTRQNSSTLYLRYMKLDIGQEVTNEILQSKGTRKSARSPHYLYTIKPVEKGSRYAIGAGESYNTVSVFEIIDVEDGVNSVEIAIPDAKRDDYVVVDLLSPSGQQIYDAQFGVRVQSSKYNRNASTAQSHIGDDGRFWIKHVDTRNRKPEDLTDATWYVSATTAEYGRMEVSYTRGAASEVSIQFRPPGSLQVRLSESRTDQLKKYEVRVYLKTEEGGKTRSSYIGKRDFGAAGTLNFETLAQGVYNVQLRLRLGGRMTTIDSQEIQIGAGQSSAMFSPPVLHDVDIILDGIKASRVYLSPKNRNGGYVTINQVPDASGRVTFKDLPAGEYRVYASGGSWKPITVPTGGLISYGK